MDNQLLSSEEIKELMNGAAENVQITREEMDALGEIGNISIGTSATTLYSLLRNKVVITTPRVYITNIKKLKEAYPIPFISIEVSYTKGLNGSTLMIMKEDDAKIIADLMMGGDGSNVNVELDDIRMSAVGEAMNQMMGSAATSLSIMLKKDINISPPCVTRINLATDSLKGYFDEDEAIVTISFKMEVGDFLKSEIMQLMPIPFAKSLVEQLYTLSLSETTTNTDGTNDKKINEEPKQMHSEQTPVQNITEQESVLTMPQKEPLRSAQNAEVTVKPVEFHTFKEEPTTAQSSSLDLILDVPLEVTVELGRTEKTIDYKGNFRNIFRNHYRVR